MSVSPRPSAYREPVERQLLCIQGDASGPLSSSARAANASHGLSDWTEWVEPSSAPFSFPSRIEMGSPPRLIYVTPASELWASERAGRVLPGNGAARRAGWRACWWSGCFGDWGRWRRCPEMCDHVTALSLSLSLTYSNGATESHRDQKSTLLRKNAWKAFRNVNLSTFIKRFKNIWQIILGAHKMKM